MNSIEPKLKKVFEKIFNQEIDIHRELTASDVDGWDSLAHIQLIVAIEKEFNFKFKSSDILKLKNVGQMIDHIESKLRTSK